MTANVIQKIPMSRIICDGNVRTQIDESLIDGLAASMQSVGQLVPARVRPHEDKFCITDGSRRFRAALKLGWPTLDAIIESQDLKEGEVLTIQLVSNCQRADLPVLDKSRAIERLMQSTGWNASEAASRLGMSNATVTRLLCLLSLPEEIQRQVESGKLAPSTAYELTRVDDPQKQAELFRAAAQGKLTRDAASGQAKSAKKQTASQRPRTSTRVVAMLGADRSVSLAGITPSLDSVIACLEEFLSRARKARTQGLELGTFTKMLRDTAKREGGVS
jgi:ParB family transcriptional regulator, chromosome partitioning protein